MFRSKCIELIYLFLIFMFIIILKMDNFIEQQPEEHIYGNNIIWKGKINRQNPVEVLKLRKKQLLSKIQTSQQSNTYLDYLLSLRDQTNSQVNTPVHDQQESDLPKIIQQSKISPQKDIQQFSENYHSLSEILIPRQFNTFKRKGNNNSQIAKSQRPRKKSKIAENKPMSLKKLAPIQQYKRNRHRQSQKSCRKEQPHYLSQRSNDILQIFVKNLSKNTDKRTSQQIKTLKSYLVKNNEFFGKIPEKIAICLIKIAAYHRYTAGSCIYKIKQARTCMYIILQGVVNCSNPTLQLKKLLFSGQLFGEQMVLSNVPALESTKAVTKSIIMALGRDQLKILQEQSKRLNFEDQFKVFWRYVKRGYQNKIAYKNQSAFPQHKN